MLGLYHNNFCLSSIKFIHLFATVVAVIMRIFLMASAIVAPILPRQPYCDLIYCVPMPVPRWATSAAGIAFISSINESEKNGYLNAIYIDAYRSIYSSIVMHPQSPPAAGAIRAIFRSHTHTGIRPCHTSLFGGSNQVHRQSWSGCGRRWFAFSSGTRKKKLCILL